MAGFDHLQLRAPAAFHTLPVDFLNVVIYQHCSRDRMLGEDRVGAAGEIAVAGQGDGEGEDGLGVWMGGVYC